MVFIKNQKLKKMSAAAAKEQEIEPEAELATPPPQERRLAPPANKYLMKESQVDVGALGELPAFDKVGMLNAHK